MDEEILMTLKKKATGYVADEIQEEYSVKEEGAMQLVKRKVTKKYFPPDSVALKAYIELNEQKGSVQAMSDTELQKEKERLLNMIAEKNKKQTSAKSKKK